MGEPTIDRAAFHTLCCGLDIVSSLDKNGHACGCVINTLLQVTSNPPQVLIAVNKDNSTCKAIDEFGYFCVTALSQNATMDLIGEFGFKSSYEVNKFANFSVKKGMHGIPYVTEDAVSLFCCKVNNRIDAGTHLVFIAAVEEAQKLSDATPLTYDYYHTVIKGGTPPKASSYDPTNALMPVEESTAEEIAAEEDSADGVPRIGWKCLLCGTVVEGYPDGLPEDFKCPVCGVGREFFQKVEL